MGDGSCMPVQTGIVSDIKDAVVADFGRVSEEQLRSRHVIHHNRRSEHDEIAHAIVESGGLSDGDGDDGADVDRASHERGDHALVGEGGGDEGGEVGGEVDGWHLVDNVSMRGRDHDGVVDGGGDADDGLGGLGRAWHDDLGSGGDHVPGEEDGGGVGGDGGHTVEADDCDGKREGQLDGRRRVVHGTRRCSGGVRAGGSMCRR